MRIDAPKATTNSLSSGLRVDGGGRHQFSEGEKHVALFFSFNFRTLLGHLPHCFTGTSLLPFRLFLRPILKFWSIGVTLMRITWANHSKRWILVSNVSMTYHGFSESIEHIGLVSVCLRSSAKSMKTSAAPYLDIRNPIVV